MIGVVGFSLNSSLNGDPGFTGKVVENKDVKVPKITGFASGEPEEEIPVFVKGDVNGCAVYENACPEDTDDLFKVGPEFFLNKGGAHVGSVIGTVNVNNFTWIVCCKDILGPGADRTFYALVMGNSTFGFEGHQNYGSHAFDPAEYSPADTVDVPFANYLHYVEGECPDEWNCIVKVSPYGTFSEGIAFRNSHVWSCDTTFATVNMTSICYKPEIETNCNAEGQECDWAGSIYLNGTWLYCSFGLGDIQNPE